MKFERITAPVFVIGIVAAVVLVATVHGARSADTTVLTDSLTSCFETHDSTVIDACLKKTVRDLVKISTTKDLMDFIVATTTPTAVSSQCHLVAHAIGEETLIKTGSLEDTLTACTPACGYGCEHGAIAAQVAKEFGEVYPGEELAHADATELIAIGTSYCERDPVMCHGIGHIARINVDTLTESLQVCDSVATKYQSRDACYRGSFMEDIGSQAFAPKTTITPSKNYGYPCNTLPAPYLHACYMQIADYQHTLFVQNGVPQAAQTDIMKKVCDRVKGAARDYCYFGIGYKITFGLGEDKTLRKADPAVCGSLRGYDYVSCIEGVAFGYMTRTRYQEAIQHCDAQTDSYDVRKKCFGIIFTDGTLALDDVAPECTAAGSRACTELLAQFRAKPYVPKSYVQPLE